MPFTIGVDFGSESARALLLDVSTGTEVAVAEMTYPSGVIADRLPSSGAALPPDWALQDPDDYLTTMVSTVREILRVSAIDPADVIGIGTDFTSCTMLPVAADGTPLCRLEGWSEQAHAWPKLWKHHAAQAQADRITALAAELDPVRLARFGGKISAEWMFPKALQILEEAPDVYHRADRLIEAQDWIIWQLCGHEVRSLAGAAFKAMYLPDQGGYPTPDFLARLHPEFADVADTKLGPVFAQPGELVGGLVPDMAQQLGLRAGTAIAGPNMDALASVVACGVTTPGTMVMVMGTSTCDFVLGTELLAVEGMCGAAENVVIPDVWTYEAGQNSVGDLFGWFVRESVPERYQENAAAAGLSTFEYLEMVAADQAPGAHGLIALDWWSGNRSVLVDADLTGLLVGMSLATRAPDIYRALLEATAFGTRTILDTFATAGIPVTELVACGGLPRKSPLLMQLYADITGRPVRVMESRQIPARGAALHAAVAAGTDAGGFSSVATAAHALAGREQTRYLPDPLTAVVYQQMYLDYLALHDRFGRADDLMRRLKDRRRNSTVPVDHERVEI